MRIVITLLFASCCFGQVKHNATATGSGGDSALKRKATPHTVSALAPDRRPAGDTRVATAGIIDLEVGDDAACQTDTADSKLQRLPYRDRKSTRLNSSHLGISYALFCLKK